MSMYLQGGGHSEMYAEAEWKAKFGRMCQPGRRGGLGACANGHHERCSGQAPHGAACACRCHS